ncbi:MAG: sugar phosphate nucleotidyltransferase [Bernardetiaceae bacterium]|nr:sugar phosphate nucleotidyltransferase [Bernardetiaceae bacterium]
MKIIVPMAGRGTRLRPHTLTIPKPLLPIAGKPIVQRLMEDIAVVCNDKIEEIAFIIGDFGAQVERDLAKIAESLGAKASIYYQDQPLGTAHALMCAKESLSGELVIAFADTLFKADFQLDRSQDGTIWVQKVDNPSSYGVIKTNEQGYITDFVEKPAHFVSDMAIIGIYYVKNGDALRDEMQYLLDNDIKDKGEYQLTNALENLKTKGVKFVPSLISEWLDCGNKDFTVHTNKRYLEYLHERTTNGQSQEKLVAESAKNLHSVIIPPVFIGENAVIHHSVIGPHVSIGANTVVKNSVISNSIVQQNAVLENVNLENALVGNYVKYQGKPSDLSIGDYCTVKL